MLFAKVFYYTVYSVISYIYYTPVVVIVDALDDPEAIISPQIKQMLLVLQVRMWYFVLKIVNT